MRLRLAHRPYQQAYVFATGATLASTIQSAQSVWLGRGAGLAFLIIVLPTPTLLRCLHTIPTALAMWATVVVEEALPVHSVVWATMPMCRAQLRVWCVLWVATAPTPLFKLHV